jgi:exopolysaccharide biosynthesis WecB/TagA/CpsF family protein
MSLSLTEEPLAPAPSAPAPAPRARFDTVEADPWSVEAWLERLELDVARRRRGLQGVRLATSINGATVARARGDADFRAMMAAFDYVDLDGMSMVYWSRLVRGPSAPERVATTDFIHDAARRAAERGLSFYLLGATEESNAAAAARLAALYPGLVVAGRRHGYFDLEAADPIVEDINRSRADVVWVALGVPREHRFILANRERFTHAAWVKSCGGCFDFLSEKVARAPGWMQKLGLEWSFRLAQEPRRLFWRYAITNPQAVMLMCRQMWTDRRRGPPA